MSDATLDRGTMDIQQLSTYGLLMLYQAVRLALDRGTSRRQPVPGHQGVTLNGTDNGRRT